MSTKINRDACHCGQFTTCADPLYGAICPSCATLAAGFDRLAWLTTIRPALDEAQALGEELAEITGYNPHPRAAVGAGLWSEGRRPEVSLW